MLCIYETETTVNLAAAQLLKQTLRKKRERCADQFDAGRREEEQQRADAKSQKLRDAALGPSLQQKDMFEVTFMVNGVSTDP